MNFERLTVSAQEVVQAGRRLAEEHNHQHMESCHLFLPMLDQDQSVVRAILSKADAKIDALRQVADTTLQGLPSVQRIENQEVY